MIGQILIASLVKVPLMFLLETSEYSDQDFIKGAISIVAVGAIVFFLVNAWASGGGGGRRRR